MITLAAEIRTWIEDWSDELTRSPLFRLTKAGKLTPRALAVYLESLRYLFKGSRESLMLAGERSSRLGYEAFALYFAHKVAEESGHDTWAIDDLARLPRNTAEGVEPASTIVALVALQRRLIAQHPMCFVAYAQWAEYFTVLVGDAWLEALEASGYARSGISAIAKHVEADRLHAANGFAEIDRLWEGQPDRATVLGALERAGCAFLSFCDEIAGVATRAA